LSDAERAGRISISPDSPADLAIQASLTAAGEFAVEGAQKTLLAAGGVQAGNLELNGNTLKVLPDERLLANKLQPLAFPASDLPLLVVLSLQPLKWIEN
jgi:hypothetical protein